VEVGEPPPPPLSEQPFVNDSGAPGLFESGEYDATKPTLSRVAVRRAGKGARIRFSVSERARVVARFSRAGKVRKAATVSAAGDGVIRKSLDPGRYRVVLRAQDMAGKASVKLVRHLTIR
jgi:hypothetical protein